MRKLNLYDVYDNVVFSYKTDHKFHGSKRITIEAPVVLNKVGFTVTFNVAKLSQPVTALVSVEV